MSKAAGYYLISGALGAGGTAAAAHFFRLALQESALQLRLREAEHVARLVQVKIDHAQLHERARSLGIDPEHVAQALTEARSKLGEIPSRPPLAE